MGCRSKTSITFLTTIDVTVGLLKENLIFSCNDNPLSNLLLWIISSLSEWERAVIKSRWMEGVKIAQERGVYKERCGRKRKLTEELLEVRQRVKAGEPRTNIIKSLGMSRQTIYNQVPTQLANGRTISASVDRFACQYPDRYRSHE